MSGGWGSSYGPKPKLITDHGFHARDDGLPVCSYRPESEGVVGFECGKPVEAHSCIETSREPSASGCETIFEFEKELLNKQAVISAGFPAPRPGVNLGFVGEALTFMYQLGVKHAMRAKDSDQHELWCRCVYMNPVTGKPYTCNCK
jgi:hypothetical protein